MSEGKEERRVKESRILLVKFQLVFDAISRIVESVDFIQPEGFLVKGIGPQSKTNKETNNYDKKLLPKHLTHCQTH